MMYEQLVIGKVDEIIKALSICKNTFQTILSYGNKINVKPFLV